MHVMAGQEAMFTCAGEAAAILWFIDNTTIEDFGIMAMSQPMDGVRTSNLIISDVIKFNNASIVCVLYYSFVATDPLPMVVLTVSGKLLITCISLFLNSASEVICV